MDSERPEPTPDEGRASRWQASADFGQTSKPQENSGEGLQNPARAARWEQSAQDIDLGAYLKSQESSRYYLPPDIPSAPFPSLEPVVRPGMIAGGQSGRVSVDTSGEVVTEVTSGPGAGTRIVTDAEGTPLSERSLFESISKIPENIKSFRIFGKSIGELSKAAIKSTFTKENAFFFGAGVLIRIGMGSTGLGGISLSAAAGGAMGGLKEHYKQTNAEWLRIKELRKGQTLTPEEAAKIRLNLKDTLGGMKNAVAKKKVGTAIVRGAVFGAFGNIAAEWLAESGLGKAAGETLHKVGKTVAEVSNLAGRLPWDKGSFIEPSRFMKGPLKIPDNAPTWLQYDNIHSLDGEYGRTIQGTVGEHLPGIRDEALRVLNEVANSQNRSVSYEQWWTIQNHIQHIAEVRANEAFDSHLQQVVEGTQDLEEVKRLGREAFRQWLEKSSHEDMAQAVKDIFSAENQINSVMEASPSLVENKLLPARQNFLDVLFHPDVRTNVEYYKKIIPDLAANIAVNQDVLMDGWMAQNSYEYQFNAQDPFPPFPAYLGELNYLMEKAEAGDGVALRRLIEAFRGTLPKDANFRVLSPEGVKRVLEILKKFG